MRAISVVDNELTAVVIRRIGQKQRGGNIRPHADAGMRNGTNGAVNMRVEFHTRVVAIEQRRQNPQWHRCRIESWIAAERLQDDVPGLHPCRRAFGNLQS